MKPAVSYTRVSSREQQQEGFSLGAQAKTLDEYARGQGVSVVRSFEDVETAKTSGRQQFNAMIKWLKANRGCRTILVEKTDRLYRNLPDAATLEELDVEIHLVKENQIISKDSKSQARLIHGLNLVLARNYSENLREEVKKGMREKASTGVFPGLAPFGYRNDKTTRTIIADQVDSVMVKRMMEAYSSGVHSLTTLRALLQDEYGKIMSRANIHLVLRNRFYVGQFVWGGETWRGTQPLFVDVGTFDRVQEVLAGHNRPKGQKRNIAFRGLLNCAYDGCLLTGDVQKEKYVYYRCSASRGKCELPRFREELMAERLGAPLKGLMVPADVADRIISALREDDGRAVEQLETERKRLHARLMTIRGRMDAAYNDKLDGAVTEEFWRRKMTDWQNEEQAVQHALDRLAAPIRDDRALDAERIFELANKAYSLYISQNSIEQAKLLRMVCSNFSVNDVSATPVYRYPFDRIFERAKTEEWSGRLDSN